MDIVVNGKPFLLTPQVDNQHTALSHVLQQLKPKKPYAVALNGAFVANHQYATTAINPQDKIDVVSPIFGG